MSKKFRIKNVVRSVLLFLGGLVILGILIFVLTSESNRKPKVKFEVKASAPQSSVEEIEAGDDSRLPASVSGRQRKIDSFRIQQERKRFLWVCQQLEKKQLKRWKKFSNSIPELKQAGSSNSPLALTSDWKRLSALIEESESARNLASDETRLNDKLRSLRDRFLKK